VGEDAALALGPALGLDDAGPGLALASGVADGASVGEALGGAVTVNVSSPRRMSPSPATLVHWIVCGPGSTRTSPDIVTAFVASGASVTATFPFAPTTSAWLPLASASLKVSTILIVGPSTVAPSSGCAETRSAWPRVTGGASSIARAIAAAGMSRRIAGSLLEAAE
jgi:hypothetical protein